MTKIGLAIPLLAGVGIIQFLILPFYIKMPEGSKVAGFSLLVMVLLMVMASRRGEWFLPAGLLPLAGLVGAFGISQAFSLMPSVGLAETWTLATGTLFCFLVANIAREEKDFPRMTLVALCLIGFLVAVLCIYQYSYWMAFGPSKNILIPYLLPPLGGRRVTGPYGQANLTALLLLLSMLAFLWHYVRRSRNGYMPRDFLADIGLFTVSGAFFLTGSRSGMVAFSVVVLLLGWAFVKKKMNIRVSTLLRIAVILGCGYSITQLMLPSEFVHQNVFSRSEINVDARFVFWMASLLIFLDFPLFGIGPDHFKLYLPDYRLKSHEALGFVEYETMGYTNWSHNEILQVLAETGLMGGLCLLLFLIFFGAAAREEMQRENNEPERLIILMGIVAILVQANFSWSLRHPALVSIFFLFLGILFSRTHQGWWVATRRWGGVMAGIFLVFSVSGLIFYSVKEYRFNQARELIDTDGCSSVMLRDLYEDRHLRFPMLREILPLCDKQESPKGIHPSNEELRMYYEEITRLQGTHTQWYNLARIYRRLGMVTQAKSALEKSIELQPVFEKGWKALHFLNIEEAVRRTGRPIENFLPDPNLSVEINGYDSIFKRQQDLQN